MMPHHLKMLIVVLAFPLTFILGVGLYQGYMTYIHIPTIAPPNLARIQYPNYHLVALNALEKFAALPPLNQQEIRNTLKENLIDFKPWVTAFSENPPQLICLGENHDDHTRLFLANSFFTRFKPDILMVEATSEELAQIQYNSRPYVPLLNADISAVLKAQSPSTKIVGIEQTNAQKNISREQAIYHNLLKAVQTKRTNLVLFGALHCGDFDGWLYDLISTSKAPFVPDQITNLRVLGEHQDGSLEAFIYFLDEIGLRRNNFTITNTRRLSTWVYTQFPVLNDQTLKHYDTVIVFRSK